MSEMSSKPNYTRLSKFLSLVLRHQPELLGLELDASGYVAFQELLAAMRNRSEWKDVTEEVILEVVSASDKQRFEVRDSLIRARYGHSVAEQITHPEAEPPEILYHGTAPDS